MAEYWVMGKNRKNSFTLSVKSILKKCQSNTIKEIFQQSFLQSPLVNLLSYILQNCVMFLNVSFPFPHNFTVKINIQKVKNDSNTIYLAKPLLPRNCILPFPIVCGLLAQLPTGEVDSTSKMLLLWDFGMLRQAGTNPPARFIWMSLQEESNYRIIVYHSSNLSSRNYIYLFFIIT